ncbi:hypothetical protein MSG28_001443 [Choristoneura fumiferana]|uniref:Uncharacterized protein n=1 Tax=Choristoneura fumiferana TaxID=7141 RepID=A0ACC0KUK9_CHOFU|nr:hypothetical protein MSG28_001443 [Choristoneura fumiferana]
MEKPEKDKPYSVIIFSYENNEYLQNVQSLTVLCYTNLKEAFAVEKPRQTASSSSDKRKITKNKKYRSPPSLPMKPIEEELNEIHAKKGHEVFSNIYDTLRDLTRRDVMRSGRRGDSRTLPPPGSVLPPPSAALPRHLYRSNREADNFMSDGAFGRVTFSEGKQQANSVGNSTEVSEHSTEVLHGLSHDYNVVGESKMSEILAINVDASSFPVQNLKSILQCSGEQFRRDHISLSDSPLQRNRLRALILDDNGSETWCFTIALINRLRVAQRAMERAMLGFLYEIELEMRRYVEEQGRDEVILVTVALEVPLSRLLCEDMEGAITSTYECKKIYPGSAKPGAEKNPAETKREQRIVVNYVVNKLTFEDEKINKKLNGANLNAEVQDMNNTDPSKKLVPNKKKGHEVFSNIYDTLRDLTRRDVMRSGRRGDSRTLPPPGSVLPPPSAALPRHLYRSNREADNFMSDGAFGRVTFSEGKQQFRKEVAVTYGWTDRQTDMTNP